MSDITHMVFHNAVVEKSYPLETLVVKFNNQMSQKIVLLWVLLLQIYVIANEQLFTHINTLRYI